MRQFRPLFWCSAGIGICVSLVAACAEHGLLAFAAALALMALLSGAWLADESSRLLVVLQRARRIRQIRASRAPAAVCTDDIH